MAKNLLSVRGAKRKPRVTRSEAYLINKKYLGEEPELKGEVTNSQYASALNWYNYMCDTGEARQYINDYLKVKNRLSEMKTLKRVPDSRINQTAAWSARLMTRGVTVVDHDMLPFFNDRMKDMLSYASHEVPKDEEVTKVSIQDRVREKAHDIIGDIEEMLDTTEYGTKGEFNLYEYLKANQVPAMYMQRIIIRFSPWLAELIEAYEGKDDQLKEAYGYMKKAQLKDRILFFSRLIEDAEKYGNVAKKTRAPRKPRAVSKEKILKNLKFQKEDSTFKIASINPEKILGAQELWTFNTKYKVLTVFRALDRGGLQVKRTMITGYDEKTSMSRGCGRQAEKVVYNILQGGKITLRKQMDELKTQKPLQDRINENTILLKVVS